MMKFEWDGVKSRANREKHGIDFETARELWLDKDRIEIEAPHPVEKRNIIIAKLQGKLWTAVYTMRSNAVRIISVRRSQEKEEKLYGKAKAG
ncbi:MAG: BrnT family toxin [Nitrospirota bacterium]